MPLTEEQIKQVIKNPNFKDKELLLEISNLFADREEAVVFLQLYGEQCELVDDMVDEPYDSRRVDKLGQLRMSINECPYWQKWAYALTLLERIIHNTYFDSVQWEKSEEEWKRRDARCLSHCGYMMLFAVIIIEHGYETLEKISLRFREHAHERHLHDPI